MIAGMVIAWSIYYTVSKLTVDATGSALTAGFLLRSAALLFLTVQLVIDGTFAGLVKQGRAVFPLVAIGVFGFLLDLFANLGYRCGSLGTGTALLKTDVLMVNLVTVLVMRKKLYATDWIGTFVMLGGVLLVLGVDFSGVNFRATDLFFLASAACVTANAFLIKHVQQKHGTDSDTISYYNNFVVLLLFALFSFAGGGLSSLRAETLGRIWPLVLLGGLAQTGIYFFYYRNLRSMEVWAVKLWLLLMPVLSCLIGAAFLNERLTAWKAAGIAVVLAGAALILLREKLNGRKRAAADNANENENANDNDNANANDNADGNGNENENGNDR